jgi:deoxyribonuclease IV
MDKKKLLLGAHMSIAGGAQKALYQGASIGCTAIQIFTDSNRRWGTKEFSETDIELFRKAQQETGINDVIAHASYLINLGSVSKQIQEKAIKALSRELTNCEKLGIKYLVLHPGAGLTPAQACLEQVVANIDKVLKLYTGPVMILFENTAGQGTSIGHTFEQLAFLRESVHDKKRIGICFDTCHAWAAGYDFSTPEGYKKVWHEFDKTIGIAHLKAMHMNNSAKKLDSHVDRHAHIDKGLIPLEAFSLLMNDPHFFGVAKILETPKTDGLAGYAKDLEILKNLMR